MGTKNILLHMHRANHTLMLENTTPKLEMLIEPKHSF